ncbi:carbohydrate esterase family 12 protein [Bipolaris maydis ATCC 48331]|uniref:Carbohydrate esterase family 12 protein n=2 Tax=Cochliobolus heterostrophus TaxID=5016 RepID=M2TIU8_COCH5|nr:carbohydrate esterase family 12 protein [Bipolaris maydis ATCC 48331]EMD97335.1 carbohydrate esterase family 12 protein [Bipolaris maydis C5]KAJ5029755.1 carbohydrate esterase [Bipolaris maydis]ENI04208.1 carbohydrate esterase family 12 protein [Bipolaris maydis ATCC 48331]KAJ5055219.1 esterase [Bipolaris maydis]KAJ5061485.1 esterase [Bipolaris maydis]
MRFTLLSLLPLSLAAPSSLRDATAKPIYWLLAGDSTTATSGGWGDAFLSKTVAPGSSGKNYGHSGATTASFRAGGDWGRVIKDISNHKEDYDVYVTIQFGHNDQKETSGVTPTQYRTNLATFASEVKSSGATPILVTPLTRRTFNTTTKRVIENLARETALTIDVATSSNLHFIDLNKASTTYVNAIGQAGADTYNWVGNGSTARDRTHLNPWGEVVFGRLVSDLLVEKYAGEFKQWTVGNETLSRLIREGKLA